MDTQAIIEDYVNKVAAKLPRKLRDDVGLELLTLLTEELRSAAQYAGRSPDSEMAMDMLEFEPKRQMRNSAERLKLAHRPELFTTAASGL